MPHTANHIAVVMDGNGRWASDIGQPRVFGHQVGSRVVRELVEAACEFDIKQLTVFALSTENLSRPRAEVAHLLDLCISNIEAHLHKLHEQGVRVQFIGNIAQLGDKLLEAVTRAEEYTKDNTRLLLTIALNFSGRWHIIETTKQLLSSGQVLSDEDIHDAFMALLPSSPDILIRTGGENRLSNFLLYHLAYTELFFLDVRWPDFKKRHLEQVIKAYRLRERRYGKIVETV